MPTGPDKARVETNAHAPLRRGVLVVKLRRSVHSEDLSSIPEERALPSEPVGASARTVGLIDTMMKRGILLSLVALALLCLDLIRFPDFLDDRVLLPKVSVSSIVNGDLAEVGKCHLHVVRVSSGKIGDEEYVRRLGPHVNGLAMTAFSTEEAEGVAIGAFANVVMDLLPTTDAQRLRALIRENPRLAPGSVQVLEVSKGQRSGPLANIDYLLVLRAARGRDRQARLSLQEGLLEILKKAGDVGVSGLLMPPLSVATTTTEAKGAPTFDDFFRSLFAAMRGSPSPPSIDVSFYEEWPTEAIEQATSTFNAYWSTEMRGAGGVLGCIHRYQLRLLLLGLSVCIAMSGRRIRFDLRSASIVVVSYSLMLLGAFKTIETLTEGLTDARGVLLLATTILLAIFFPSIVGWSAKDLFAEVGHRAQG